MADPAVATTSVPAWVDLGSTDAAASRAFYADLFGWDVEVNEDPQYGGYALARIGGRDAAGISPTMSPDQPSAWSLYISTDDADAVARRVSEAGGTVVAPPFAVGDQGRMAVFQDPSGAYISVWQAERMRGFATDGNGSFGWAELSARGIDEVLPFYEQVFGWTTQSSGEGSDRYIQFYQGDKSIAGAMEMAPMVPAEMPSYWLVYFTVDDVDATFQRAVAAGSRPLVPPTEAMGQYFAILQDPQGAAFGLAK
jgi:uncharacterized protein